MVDDARSLLKMFLADRIAVELEAASEKRAG